MSLQKKIIFLLLIIGAGCSGDTKPTTDEVEPSLKVYLVAEKARECRGSVKVDHLKVTRVGDFEERFGGWPVYATFAVTCTDGANTLTWNSNDPSDKVMTCVCKKTGTGDYECFMPDMFRVAQEQLKRQMQEMMKK